MKRIRIVHWIGMIIMTPALLAAEAPAVPSAVEQFDTKSVWLYTGNSDKKLDFSHYFSHNTDEAYTNWKIHFPLGKIEEIQELDTEFNIVAARKAYDVWKKTGYEYMVEDTSLGVVGVTGMEGVDENGVRIKWVQETIRKNIARFIGKKAVFRVSIAQVDVGIIRVYTGIVKGVICAPRGQKGFGFDDFFQPSDQLYQAGGKYKTLAEMKETQGPHKWDQWNARALAIALYKAPAYTQSYSVAEIEAISPLVWQ